MKTIITVALLAASSLSAAERVPLPAVPNEPWKPAPEMVRRYETATPHPTETLPSTAGLTLADLVDYALRNNPSTRIAWLEARAAAETLASQESAYLPEVDANATLGRSHNASGNSHTTVTPSLSLSYLLFDFGGREAAVRAARETLIAADYTHNAVIHDVALRVEQSYFDYLATKALLEAQQTIVKQFQANLDAAEERRRVGVATIADVLQARTLLSQARLNAEVSAGSLRSIQGALASAVGIPPQTELPLGELPPDVATEQLNQDITTLMNDAVAHRPDIAAARARAERAAARVDQVRAEGLPALRLNASAGRSIAFGAPDSNNWSAAVLFSYPLFTGFRNTHDVRQAKLQSEIAREDVRSIEQQVSQQVWSSYYTLQTAAQRVATSRDLLASARQSAEVARARYREGLGTILDLLTAESSMANAVALEIGARADWLVALAQLAHDTGSLQTAPSALPSAQ